MRIRRLRVFLVVFVLCMVSTPSSDALPISCRKVFCGAQCNISGYDFCIWGYDYEYGCSQLAGGCASIRNASCCMDGPVF